MNIYGCHFTYGSVDSVDYSLIIANVDTDRDDRSSGDITGEFIYRKSDKTFRLIGDDLSGSQMAFDVNIITDDEHILPAADRRAIEKWLFNKPTFRKLYIDEADDTLDESFEYIDGVKKRFYVLCRFVNPVKIETGCGVVGYKATMQCDSPLLWQDEISVAFTSSSSSGTFEIDVDTDLNDYTYPSVVIVTGSNCQTFSIVNQTDNANRATTFSGLSGSDHISMNGNLGYVDAVHYPYFAGLNFIRLLDGKNVFTYTGRLESIQITWQNRRFW